MGTEPGKAGFLTACYILLVPVFGLFLKKKCGFNIWIGVVIAVVGLYFLCMNGSISFETSDLMTLLCAVLFSFHILIIDHFSPLVDGEDVLYTVFYLRYRGHYPYVHIRYGTQYFRDK